MEDWKELQRQAYQNKVDHGFNVTDVPMEFCLLYGEVGEAYQAWSRQKPDLGEEATAAAVEKFKALAEQHGTNVEVDEWGKRRLAYAIDYKTEGYYVLMSFTSDAAFPKELDRVLGITTGMMRSMIVCKGE